MTVVPKRSTLAYDGLTVTEGDGQSRLFVLGIRYFVLFTRYERVLGSGRHGVRRCVGGGFHSIPALLYPFVSNVKPKLYREALDSVHEQYHSR